MSGSSTAEHQERLIEPSDENQSTGDPAWRRPYGVLEKTVDAFVAFICFAVGTAWTFNPFRTQFTAGTFSNYFESQALSFVQGRLAVEKGLLGIEAFIRDGKDYMYFGPLLGLFRVPFVALGIELDGRATLISMLAATGLLYWQSIKLLDLTIDVFHPESRRSAIERWLRLAWRVSVASGSVVLALLAIPWSYHEAHLWSAAVFVTVLNQIIRLPTMPPRRIWIFGVSLLVLVTNRPTTAYAGLIGVAVLLVVVLWRRSVAPGAVVQLAGWWTLALCTTVTVNWMKFRRPFGIPMEDQLFTSIDANRAEMLDRYDNRYFQLEFIPTNLWAYFRPTGIDISSQFPFVDIPRDLPHVFGDAFYDATYRTASVTATSPLLTSASVIGVITFVRIIGQPSFWRVAPAVVAGVLATGAVTGWGYIATRYLTDFLPGMLVLSAIAGATFIRWVDTCDRTPGPGRLRIGGLGVAGLIAWSTIAWIAIGFNYSYSLGDRTDRMAGLLAIQDAASRFSGPSLESRTTRLVTLPSDRYNPASPGTLAIVGDCDALYYSNGETVDTWVTVEYATGKWRRDYRIVTNSELTPDTEIGLLRLSEDANFASGAYRFDLVMRIDDIGEDHFEYSLIMYDSYGMLIAEDLHAPHRRPTVLSITFDYPRRVLFVEQDGRNVLYGHFDMGPLFDSSDPGIRYMDAGERDGLTSDELVLDTPWCDRLLASISD